MARDAVALRVWLGGGSAIDDAVAAISSQASVAGLTLLEQSTYSMAGTSSSSFTFDPTYEATMGDSVYRVFVVAPMPVTAVAGSTQLGEAYYSEDVFVRVGDVTLAEGASTSFSISADGSERGDIKLLVFGNLGD